MTWMNWFPASGGAHNLQRLSQQASFIAGVLNRSSTKETPEHERLVAGGILLSTLSIAEGRETENTACQRLFCISVAGGGGAGRFFFFFSPEGARHICAQR